MIKPKTVSKAFVARKCIIVFGWPQYSEASSGIVPGNILSENIAITLGPHDAEANIIMCGRHLLYQVAALAVHHDPNPAPRDGALEDNGRFTNDANAQRAGILTVDRMPQHEQRGWSLHRQDGIRPRTIEIVEKKGRRIGPNMISALKRRPAGRGKKKKKQQTHNKST